MSVGEDTFYDALQEGGWGFLAQGLFYHSLCKGNPGAPPERMKGCSSNMAYSRLEKERKRKEEKEKKSTSERCAFTSKLIVYLEESL
jgi:hypothetical protein